MALVLQEHIHYSYHLIRNALYIPQQSATAFHQLLPRSQQEKKKYCQRSLSALYSPKKSRQYHTVQYEIKSKIFLSRTTAHLTDVNKDFSF